MWPVRVLWQKVKSRFWPREQYCPKCQWLQLNFNFDIDWYQPAPSEPYKLTDLVVRNRISPYEVEKGGVTPSSFKPQSCGEFS